MGKEWFAVMSRKNTLVVLGQGETGDFPRRVRESLRHFLDRHWTNFWVVWRENGAYRLVRYQARKEDRKTTVICSTIAEGEAYVWTAGGKGAAVNVKPSVVRSSIVRRGIPGCKGKAERKFSIRP